MPLSSRTRRAGLVILAPLVFSLSAAMAEPAQGKVVTSHIPEMVQNGRAHLVAPFDTQEKLTLGLNLALRNEAQLDALLADLYNPKSPNFITG